MSRSSRKTGISSTCILRAGQQSSFRKLECRKERLYIKHLIRMEKTDILSYRQGMYGRPGPGWGFANEWLSPRDGKLYYHWYYDTCIYYNLRYNRKWIDRETGKTDWRTLGK